LPALRLAALTAFAVLGLFAAPAQATLLVRSDGAGLLIQDKNGISDHADVFNVNSGTAFRVRNLNDLDIFKFDRQTGCSEHSSFEVTCERHTNKINVVLAGGNDDFSIGAPSPASVNAGSGSDRIFSSTGADTISSFSGDDEINSGGGNDNLDGGEGADEIQAGQGVDVLEDPGGNDALYAREAAGTTPIADTVKCGPGTDFAQGDLKDIVSSTCENKDIAPVGEHNVKLLSARTVRVAMNGAAVARLRCPRANGRRGCDGRLQLAVGRGGGGARASASPRVHYRIRAGGTRSVALRLRAADLRRLRAGLRRGVLTSVEKGIIGPKTTVRTPRLVLRRR
jgi:Ca2+-binding RTX toxin-like protein